MRKEVTHITCNVSLVDFSNLGDKLPNQSPYLLFFQGIIIMGSWVGNLLSKARRDVSPMVKHLLWEHCEAVVDH